MKPRPFDYVRPDTVDEAVALLAEHGDEARVLAGGQSLMAMLNLRLVDPGDADRHRADRRNSTRIRDLGDTIEVGAAVTQNKLLAWPELAEEAAAARRRAALSSAISRPATKARCAARSRTPIRARKFRCRSRRSRARWCCARQARHPRPRRRGFPARHADHRARARRTDHRGALSGGTRTRGVAFREVARRHGDFAIVAVAAMIDGQRHVRLGVGGMAGTAGWCGAFRRTTSRMRSSNWPTSSKATRTCTPRRRCGATSCAALHRSSSRRRNDAPREPRPAHPHPADAQRPHGLGRGRAAHAAQRFPAPVARRDRHPCRLRARRLRLLHGDDRRHRGALVPDARDAGGRPRGAHRRSRSPAPTASSTSCSRRSRTITRCNAASARPAF